MHAAVFQNIGILNGRVKDLRLDLSDQFRQILLQIIQLSTSEEFKIIPYWNHLLLTKQ